MAVARADHLRMRMKVSFLNHFKQQATDHTLSPSKAWPSMARNQLFSDVETCTQLVVLSSAQSPAASQKAPKRRKAPSSPSSSNLIPQYNEQMDSGGSESF
jgi:hypothetical protein